MKITLTDTSSLILMHKAGILDLFLEHYHSRISSGIYSELIVENRTGAQDFLLYCKKKRIEVVNDSSSEKIEIGLKGAEKELIRLYLAGMGDFIIIDDKAGAGYCRDNSIPYINALLLPKILFYVSIIDKKTLKSTTDRLLNAGRYASWVKDWAGSATRDMLRDFLP